MVPELSLQTPSLELFQIARILPAGQSVPKHLKLFAAQADRVLAKIARLVGRGEMSAHQAQEFQQLLVDSCNLPRLTAALPA